MQKEYDIFNETEMNESITNRECLGRLEKKGQVPVWRKERLTKKFTDGTFYCEEKVEDVGIEGLNSPTFVGKAIDKLGIYEDLEEQGLLLRQPCKVGDIVYKIEKSSRNPIVAMIVTEIRLKALRGGDVIMKIICSDEVMSKQNGCCVYYEEEIGKKLFLTQSETEKSRSRFE